MGGRIAPGAGCTRANDSNQPKTVISQPFDLPQAILDAVNVTDALKGSLPGSCR